MRSPVPRSESALDELSLVEATRPGGASSARRDHRDFAVNRRRLRDVLEVGDLVSVFGWLGSVRATLYVWAVRVG